jgi:integrase
VNGKARSTSRSLKTTDLKIAEGRAREYLAVWDRRNESLRTASSLAGLDDTETPSANLTSVAYDRVYEPIRKHLTQRRKLTPTLQEFLSKRDQDIASFSAKIIDGELSMFEVTADRLLNSQGIQLSKNSPSYREFVDAIAGGTLDALSVTVRQLRGELDAAPQSKAMQKAIEQRASTAASGRTVMELFERYVVIQVESGRKRANGISQDRMVMEHFAGFVGANRAVKSITADDVRDFRDLISCLPVGIGKRKEYRGLTLTQAVKHGEKCGHSIICPRTRARYMSTVSPFFDWLRSEGYIEIQPFEGLHQKVPKGKNRRPSYSSEQLNKMLSSPLFSGFESDGKEHRIGIVQADDWRYWTPLICIFTGARITEIAQLKVGDITQEFGAWFIHIEVDEKAGQNTKSGESRIVPIHSQLIALGVLDFTDAQRIRAQRDGNKQLFPDLKAVGDRGRLGDRPARFWREYLTAIAIKDGKDGMGTHSFRHTLSDRLRLAGFMDSQFGPVILGHSDKSVTSGYGQLQQGTAKMRSDMIEAVDFSDLDFSKLRTAKPSNHNCGAGETESGAR